MKITFQQALKIIDGSDTDTSMEAIEVGNYDANAVCDILKLLGDTPIEVIVVFPKKEVAW